MENKVLPAEPRKSRKNVGDKSKWKREIAKRHRHKAKNLPIYPKCNHDGKTYKCKKLTSQDVYVFHRNLYTCKTKTMQDFFILKYCKSCQPKRNRQEKDGSSRKGISTRYFMKKSSCERFEIQVCQKTFLDVLGISKDRVQRIVKRYLETGLMPAENRGGDRVSKKYEQKRIAVRTFIENLKGVESHYCRLKAGNRKYLGSHLSISKLWKIYNDSHDPALNVKKTFFQNIFAREYNIGFGSPVTDACSKCIELAEKIKLEKDPEKKSSLIAEKRVHTLRSKAFFEKLKEVNDSMITFSFDCQKNLVNPKVPDEIAYYSRQLYTYNFTIVQGSSKTKMTTEIVYIFTWMEHQFHKGSNEIASAVYSTLSKTDLSSYSVIRLCADGCGGQNRNSTMIGMLSYFLSQNAPSNIASIELIFPLPGRSFLPPDRVFGRIEKVLKKLPTITDPKTYLDIFKEFGTVTVLGNDCPVMDWKSSVKEFFKPVGSWHFKFSLAKRFILTKSKNGNVAVCGELYYNSNTGKAKPVLRKGKKLEHFSAQITPMGVPVKAAKLADVKKLLLKHFGEEWQQRDDLVFFKTLFSDIRQTDVTEDIIDEDDFCEQRTPEEHIEPRI